MANMDLGSALRQRLALMQPFVAQGSSAARDDAEALGEMLACWEAYKAGQQKQCLEHFCRSVQHDTPLQADVRQCPPLRSFLVKALHQAEALGVEPATAAAATAFFCLSDPSALEIKQAAAGKQLDKLAEQHPDIWWVQYARATWRVMRGDFRASAESLTRAMLAPGAPCGLYYTRARVFSNLQKADQAARDYRRFLELAPPENRSVPDAHYALALDAAYAMDMAAASKHFAAGQAAEAHVAPWVGYQPSEAKRSVQMLLAFAGTRH